MRIDILTVLPELLDSPLNQSILKRAQNKGLVEIVVHNLRDFSTDKHRRVDDYPFGGAAGMVMQIEPIDRAISQLKSERTYDEVIYTSPDGELFDQPMANSLSLAENLIILCGHYKGIDYRIREHLITREISVGDYVLTGGELPAAIMCDAIVRLIPGALRDRQSALSDSFQGNLLAPPGRIQRLARPRRAVVGSPTQNRRVEPRAVDRAHASPAPRSSCRGIRIFDATDKNIPSKKNKRPTVKQ